jgi:hypothetical protein
MTDRTVIENKQILSDKHNHKCHFNFEQAEKKEITKEESEETKETKEIKLPSSTELDKQELESVRLQMEKEYYKLKDNLFIISKKGYTSTELLMDNFGIDFNSDFAKRIQSCDWEMEGIKVTVKNKQEVSTNRVGPDYVYNYLYLYFSWKKSKKDVGKLLRDNVREHRAVMKNAKDEILQDVRKEILSKKEFIYKEIILSNSRHIKKIYLMDISCYSANMPSAIHINAYEELTESYTVCDNVKVLLREDCGCCRTKTKVYIVW